MPSGYRWRGVPIRREYYASTVILGEDYLAGQTYDMRKKMLEDPKAVQCMYKDRHGTAVLERTTCSKWRCICAWFAGAGCDGEWSAAWGKRAVVAVETGGCKQGTQLQRSASHASPPEPDRRCTSSPRLNQSILIPSISYDLSLLSTLHCRTQHSLQVGRHGCAIGGRAALGHSFL
jgi:hypothetical protein